MNTQQAPNACNNWFWPGIKQIKLASWLFLGNKNKVENSQTDPRPSVSLIFVSKQAVYSNQHLTSKIKILYLCLCIYMPSYAFLCVTVLQYSMVSG